MGLNTGVKTDSQVQTPFPSCHRERTGNEAQRPVLRAGIQEKQHKAQSGRATRTGLQPLNELIF